MGGRFTEIPPETFEQIVVDAGVLLRRFDIFDQDYDITPDIITATTGGVELSAEPEFLDLGEDVDNCANNTKELMRLANWRLTLGSTAIGSSPEIMQMILGAADLSGDIDVIPRAVLELSDFKDLWWVGDRVDGGLLAVHLANALSISGLSLQTSKAAKGQFDFEIQAHVSIYEQEKVPMTFYVMAPGSWVITGVHVPDFTVQKGVPTRVPVKYVMQDGSEMDPTDYGHDLTYSATLPPGATLTEDGILTLMGDNDKVTITATLTKGGETMSDTAEASVQALRVVGIYVETGTLILQAGGSGQIQTMLEMSDGSVVDPTDYQTNFTYTLNGAPSGTSVSASGMVTAGAVAGDFTVTVSYTSDGQTFTDTVDATIQAEAGVVDKYHITWTQYGTTLSRTVTYSYVNPGIHDIFIDWGDGTTSKVDPDATSITHTYEGANAYRISTNGWSTDNGDTYIIPNLGSMASTARIEDVYADAKEVLPALAFANRQWPTNAEFGKELTELNARVFKNNSQITKVIVRAETITLNTEEFYYTTKLKQLLLPNAKTITFVGNGWFTGSGTASGGIILDMSNVTSVPVLPADLAGSFAEIRVPAALLNDFKTATNWAAKANRFVGV